jgi:hypothetical protein
MRDSICASGKNTAKKGCSSEYGPSSRKSKSAASSPERQSFRRASDEIVSTMQASSQAEHYVKKTRKKGSEPFYRIGKGLVSKTLIEIAYQVFGSLNADRKPDHVRPGAGRQPLLIAQSPMRRAGGVQNEAAGIADIGEM